MSLLNTDAPPKSAEGGAPSKSRGDNVPFKQVIDLLEKAVPASLAVVITTMPRGSLQLVQPARLPEGLLKAYARELHLEDQLSWRVILEQKPRASRDIMREGDRFLTDHLLANGFAYAAAAPLTSPVVEGYPGAVHIYRSSDQGDFTDEEVRLLGEAARQIDEIIDKARVARRGGAAEPGLTLTPRPPGRLFIIDASGRQLMTVGEYESLDARLRELMSQEAQARLNKLDGELVTADRVQLPDSRGDLWNFRAVAYSRYPAVGDGPYVVFCMQPSCGEWATVRPADFQADQELARLIPALKFMRDEFHRGPTLGEISRTVHLSPFHFHRRFAELLGLTPKHYLLECQITEAKLQLLARKKELAQIAADCGFAHQSHFTSRFKQATGLTPTRWRRLALEVHSR